MGDNELGNSFAEKGLGVLVDNYLTKSQQYTFNSKKGQKHPTCVSKSVASRPRDVILSHSSVVMRPYLDSQDYPNNQTSPLKAQYHRYTG